MSEAVVPFIQQEPGDWLKDAIEREASRLRDERDALMKQVAPLDTRLAQLDGTLAALGDKPIVQTAAKPHRAKVGLTDAVRRALQSAHSMTTSEIRGALHRGGLLPTQTAFISQSLTTMRRRGEVTLTDGRWSKVV